MQLNMTKEYSAELRELKKQQRGWTREVGKIIAQGIKAKAAVDRQVKRDLKFAHRSSEKVNRRISILEGRLS